MYDQNEQTDDQKADEPKVDTQHLTDRWKAWQRDDGEEPREAQARERQAQAEVRRKETAEEKRARMLARREMRELAKAEREERARLRREEREVARMQAATKREIVRDQIAGIVSNVRKSAAVMRDEGIGALVRAAFARRWVVAVSLLILVGASALAGALVMRARHRSYLTAVLVAVNGKTIRRDHLNDEMHRLYGRQVLDSLVQRELRHQFLEKHGAVASDRQVDERLRLEAQSPEFMPVLQKAGKSEAEYRESLARVLSEFNLISKGVTVTEAEMRRFYTENADPRNVRALFHTPEVVTLAVIGTASRADADQARKALDAGGDWATLARRYSVDDSAQNGGVVAPFAVGRSLAAHAKGLDAVARRLQKGEQVGPVRLAGGLWWLVRCLDKQPALTRPYDEVKETVRILATAAKGEQVNGARVAAEYEAFRKKANIQTFMSR